LVNIYSNECVLNDYFIKQLSWIGQFPIQLCFSYDLKAIYGKLNVLTKNTAIWALVTGASGQ